MGILVSLQDRIRKILALIRTLYQSAGYFLGGMSAHGRPKKDQCRKRRNFENGKLIRIPLISSI